MAKHYVTNGNVYSLCEESGKDDVYTDGSFIVTGPQPTDYCSGCMEAEPEWIHLEDEEYFKLAQQIF